jgi:hypothetical protein
MADMVGIARSPLPPQHHFAFLQPWILGRAFASNPAPGAIGYFLG